MKSTTTIPTNQLSYPPQMVQFVTGSSQRNLNITGFQNGDALNTWLPNGAPNENWRVDYISDGVFRLVNLRTNGLVSVEDNAPGEAKKVVLWEDINDISQQWHLIGVEKDFLGEFLYFRIASAVNPNLVLTYNETDNQILLSSWQGTANQKWKINCDGLSGFGGNCKTAEGEKAGTIGGLLGETVFVYDLSSLKNTLLKPQPLTVVIGANIDNMEDEIYDLRIAGYKTIIGSYQANRLTDPRLRTDDYFKKEAPSNNIVLRNIHFNVANRKDVVAFAVYGSNNIWVDHCRFYCQLDLYSGEVGKFVWVNHSVYAGLDPDFVTLSYNTFYHRFWGIAFGAERTDKDRATVMYNKYESVVQRTPQLGNGLMHCLNGLYERSHATLNDDGYASIKCGDGSQIYSDANLFLGYRKEASGYWDNEVEISANAAFKDVGSYTNRGEIPTVVPYPYQPPQSPVTIWNPAENYGYIIIKAYGENDVQEFVNQYAGIVADFDSLQYINHDICERYHDKTVKNPLY